MVTFEKYNENMYCKTCIYFHVIYPSEEISGLMGECRRRAPIKGGWHEARGNDYCGDFYEPEDKNDS